MPNRRVDAAALVGRLGDWARGDGPLSARLARSLGALIESGEIPTRAVLPPERPFAAALPAARGTVVAAYNELAAQGRVERRQGSGTLVLGTAGPSTRRSEAAAALRAATLTDRMVHPTDAPIDLALSVLDHPAEAAVPDADPRVLAAAGAGHGYLPLGIAPLRARVAEIISASGMPTAPAEVMITNGAQHAIALAATLLVQGRPVAIEELTFPPAIDLYSRLGARFAPVRCDGAGIVPESLDRALAESGAGVVHLAPTVSSPLGARTTDARRRSIAAILERHPDVWLLEDDALRYLTVEGDAPPPLAASRPDRSILAGSCSKLFWGGLRIGWVRAPFPVIEQLAGWRAATDLGTAIGPQVTALLLLDDLDDAISTRRDEVRRRRDHLCGELSAALPDAVVSVPMGGLSVWLRLPGTDARAWCDRARRSGLVVLPGDTCSVGPSSGDAVRLSLWAPTDVLSAAVERLAMARVDRG